jgi:hypothetical protein
MKFMLLLFWWLQLRNAILDSVFHMRKIVTASHHVATASLCQLDLCKTCRTGIQNEVSHVRLTQTETEGRRVRETVGIIPRGTTCYVQRISGNCILTSSLFRQKWHLIQNAEEWTQYAYKFSFRTLLSTTEMLFNQSTFSCQAWRLVHRTEADQRWCPTGKCTGASLISTVC